MYLIDSHILLWRLDNSAKMLSEQVELVIDDPAVRIAVSLASVWELAIKASKGKLRLPGQLLEKIAAAGIELLPITATHAIATALLPNLHGDPFDRMLVAQARAEGLTLMTRDRRLQDYGIPVWLV
jgi:PIN domain nuclease of toxin-antitoxin system